LAWAWSACTAAAPTATPANIDNATVQRVFIAPPAVKFRLKIFHGESRHEAGESGQQEYHSQNDDIVLPVGHAGQYARMR
jgi:hypothetical protein